MKYYYRKKFEHVCPFCDVLTDAVFHINFRRFDIRVTMNKCANGHKIKSLTAMDIDKFLDDCSKEHAILITSVILEFLEQDGKAREVIETHRKHATQTRNEDKNVLKACLSCGKVYNPDYSFCPHCGLGL